MYKNKKSEKKRGVIKNLTLYLCKNGQYKGKDMATKIRM